MVTSVKSISVEEGGEKDRKIPGSVRASFIPKKHNEIRTFNTSLNNFKQLLLSVIKAS